MPAIGTGTGRGGCFPLTLEAHLVPLQSIPLTNLVRLLLGSVVSNDALGKHLLGIGSEDVEGGCGLFQQPPTDTSTNYFKNYLPRGLANVLITLYLIHLPDSWNNPHWYLSGVPDAQDS